MLIENGRIDDHVKAPRFAHGYLTLCLSAGRRGWYGTCAIPGEVHLMLGVPTFNDLAPGVPAMVPSMLAKRLAERERAGR